MKQFLLSDHTFEDVSKMGLGPGGGPMGGQSSAVSLPDFAANMNAGYRPIE
jgi:hypothetical protein